MESSSFGLDSDVFLSTEDQLMMSDDFIGRNGKRTMLTLEDLHELVGKDALIDEVTTTRDLERITGGSTSNAKNPINFSTAQNAPYFAASLVATKIDDEPVDADEENGNYFVLHMDVRDPVKNLRPLLQVKVADIDVSKLQIWLQNAQKLSPEKNLVEQCVQGAGLVQINVELIFVDGEERINIVDVLKPTDDFLQQEGAKEKAVEKKEKTLECSNMEWEADLEFKKEMNVLQIPQNFAEWGKDDVRLWLNWAAKKFSLSDLKLSDWNMTGKELCDMTIETFHSKVKKDPKGLFWTHFELLRKCQVVAVLSGMNPSAETVPEKKQEVTNDEIFLEVDMSLRQKSPQKRHASCVPELPLPKKSRVLGSKEIVSGVKNMHPKNCQATGIVGINGQITLWQFLLELLTDKEHQAWIHFISSDGRFKLQNPEMVAKLWGRRKKKPAMTYEKLSRALRYYYDGDMIAKVPGQRFVYKFVCDLKELLGYSPAEINSLVSECAKRDHLPYFPPESFDSHLRSEVDVCKVDLTEILRPN